MSYDECLAERIREQLHSHNDVEDKKMFGGLCFMIANHMCCGIVKETLMLRVGANNYEDCLARSYTSEMDFTGKAMKGMVYVEPEGFETDADLAEWLNLCADFITSLPQKLKK